MVGNLPRCLDMITSEAVIKRIEMYLMVEPSVYLTPEWRAAEAAVRKQRNRNSAMFTP